MIRSGVPARSMGGGGNHVPRGGGGYVARGGGGGGGGGGGRVARGGGGVGFDFSSHSGPSRSRSVGFEGDHVAPRSRGDAGFFSGASSRRANPQQTVLVDDHVLPSTGSRARGTGYVSANSDSRLYADGHQIAGERSQWRGRDIFAGWSDWHPFDSIYNPFSLNPVQYIWSRPAVHIQANVDGGNYRSEASGGSAGKVALVAAAVLVTAALIVQSPGLLLTGVVIGAVGLVTI